MASPLFTKQNITALGPWLDHECSDPLRAAAVALISFGQMSLDGVAQGREALNSYFKAITRFDGPDAARRAGQNDVARQQRHVRRDKADKIIAVKDQLAGIGVLAQLPVLKELNGQIVRVDLRLDVRPERREGIE